MIHIFNIPSVRAVTVLKILLLLFVFAFSASAAEAKTVKRGPQATPVILDYAVVGGSLSCLGTTAYPNNGDGIRASWNVIHSGSGSVNLGSSVLAAPGTYTFTCTDTVSLQSAFDTLVVTDCLTGETWNGSACIASTLPPPATPPGIPPSLTVVAEACDGQIRVSWSSSTGAPAGYEIRYKLTSSPVGWTTITGVTSPHIVTGLSPGTVYDFEVQATNGAGPSGWSSSASTNASTACGLPPPTFGPELLVCPTGLSLEEGASYQMRAQYYAAGTALPADCSNGAYTNVTNNVGTNWSSDSGSVSVTNSGIKGFITAITAGSANISAAYGGVSGSVPISVTPPPPPPLPPPPAMPTGFSGTPESCGGIINLSWNSDPNAVSYQIAQDAAFSGSVITVTGTSHTIYGLTAGASYTFYLRAVNTGGPSTAASTVVSASGACNLLEVSNCTAPIPDDQNTCSARMKWDNTGASVPYAFARNSTRQVDIPGTNIASSSDTFRSVTFERSVLAPLNNAADGKNTIQIFNGAAVLRTADGFAECRTTSFFNTDPTINVCKRLPEITFVPNPIAPIRAGQTADVKFTVNASYPVACTVLGGVGPVELPVLPAHDGTPALTQHTITTVPLSSAQDVRIRCTADGLPAGVEGTIRVNVLPAIEET